MSKDNGGPAFPKKLEQCNFGYELTGGMTLRDYFAAKAMATIPQQTCNNMKDNESHEAYTARRVYAMADAMLEARK